jgi:hypothetical protein
VNRRSALISGVACALSYGPFAQSAPPVIAQTEINYLLGFIERSGCMFYRNGSWYDASQAQAHLRSKYNSLAAINRIVTAEDFIEQAATKSSLSGKAYAIRCNSDPVATTDQWLRDALVRYRLAAG